MGRPPWLRTPLMPTLEASQFTSNSFSKTNTSSLQYQPETHDHSLSLGHVIPGLAGVSPSTYRLIFCDLPLHVFDSELLDVPLSMGEFPIPFLATPCSMTFSHHG
jgi:hypothetical protein